MLLQYVDPEGQRSHVAATNPLPVSASPVTAKKVAEGKFFLAGSGRRSLAVAGNFRATIQNPAGSGRNLYLLRLVSFATATGWGRLIVNPTTGLPADAPRYTLNALCNHPNASVALLRADTSATTPLGGGTDTGIDLATPAGNRVQVDLPPFVLPEGAILGVNVPFAGAADAMLNIAWYEE